MLFPVLECSFSPLPLIQLSSDVTSSDRSECPPPLLFLIVQLIFIICGFCICELLAYLIKFVSNLKLNTHGGVLVQSGEVG